MMRRLLLTIPVVLIFGLWILFGSWPSPQREEIPWEPNAIVVLGGGDQARAREAIRLAAIYPEAPVLVTGDGGYMEKLLRANEVTRDRLVIEPEASSTWENAVLSEPILNNLHASRAVLVTNWFHVPRAGAVFAKAIPWLDFEMAWEPAPDPLSPWDRNCHRREKLAALYYLMRYGVWSF